MNVIDKNVDIKFVCARHVSGITFSRCTQNQKLENPKNLKFNLLVLYKVCIFCFDWKSKVQEQGAPMCQNMCFLIFVCEMFIFQPFLWGFFFVIFLIKFSFCNVSTNFVYGYCHIHDIRGSKRQIPKIDLLMMSPLY